MISDAATPFAVGLAKALVKLVKEVEPDWAECLFESVPPRGCCRSESLLRACLRGKVVRCCQRAAL